MNLERYRMPVSVSEGEWIELPDSDGAKFLVRLPAASNREWQREMQQLMADAGVKVDAKGEVLNPQALVGHPERRAEAFARVCVVRGPEGFDLAQLRGEYWPALLKLWEIADAKAEAQSQEAATAVGELSA